MGMTRETTKTDLCVTNFLLLAPASINLYSIQSRADRGGQARGEIATRIVLSVFGAEYSNAEIPDKLQPQQSSSYEDVRLQFFED